MSMPGRRRRGKTWCGITAIKAAGRGTVRVEPGRNYDVQTFTGDPGRAHQVLGWRAVTTLEDGIAELVERYKRVGDH